MDELRTWIIALITITILCVLVEKFAPQGNVNKYVRLVSGLVVTVVIAMPVINFLKSDFKFDDVAWNEYVKMSEGELKNRVEKLRKTDDKQILEIYRMSIINDVKNRFMGEEDFEISRVDAVLVESKEHDDFGRIRTLYITLKPAVDNQLKIITDQKLEEIKSKIAQVFDLDKQKILIDVSKFNKGG